VAALDPGTLVTPLVMATQLAPAGTMAGAGGREQQLTRRLRNALHASVSRLQFGQTLLATVGSISPFVGLLGTVWGIFHALTGIAAAGQVNIEKVAGPVGEALIMTAAGLAVAIPAVLAYNWFGRIVARLEGELEGFARDLRELFAQAH
jgi:biopolymer transport protein ExbB